MHTERLCVWCCRQCSYAIIAAGHTGSVRHMWLSRVLHAENLLQVTKKLPQRGLGKRVQRLAWKEDSYWTITAVKPSIDGDHGVASGVLTWKGQTQSERPRRINGVLKKVWRHMEPGRQLDWKTVPKPTAAAEIA